MHDIVDIERRGIPGVFIATVEFVDAAAAQSESLGLTPAAVYVEHPIQDRNDDEMLAIADAAYEEIIAAIIS